MHRWKQAQASVDFPQALSASLAGAGTPDPIPGIVVGTRTEAHEGCTCEGGRLTGQTCLPEGPPRPRGMRAPPKGLFNPGEYGCYAGLAQTRAKSAVRETKKWTREAKGFPGGPGQQARGRVGLWPGPRAPRVCRGRQSACRGAPWLAACTLVPSLGLGFPPVSASLLWSQEEGRPGCVRRNLGNHRVRGGGSRRLLRRRG